MKNQVFRGVLVPVLTPFTKQLAPDTQRFVSFCQWLLAQSADGLAIFGTTSEANSMSPEERMELLEALVEASVPPEKLMPGTGACALTDSVKLIKHAVNRGCGGVLMLPPFYYKGVSDEGLFSFFSEVIQRVGSARLRMYLYHIPPVAQIPFSLDLIGRLIKAYPETVVGIKDSSGDWSNTEAILKRFPGFGTFAGSEVFLLDTLKGGGVGCITATGNVNVAGIRNVYLNWREPRADKLQADITRIRKAIQAYPMVPALKQMVAYFHQDTAWQQVRPPFERLPDQQAEKLLAELAQLGFSMPKRQHAA